MEATCESPPLHSYASTFQLDGGRGTQHGEQHVRDSLRKHLEFTKPPKRRNRQRFCSAPSVRQSIGPRRPGDPPVLVANTAKAQEVLGWTAQRNLADIVSSAWAWMQHNGAAFLSPAGIAVRSSAIIKSPARALTCGSPLVLEV